MTVMFAQADPSLPTTTYGALYVVCKVWYFYVVRSALCLWMTTLCMDKSNPIQQRKYPQLSELTSRCSRIPHYGDDDKKGTEQKHYVKQIKRY